MMDKFIEYTMLAIGLATVLLCADLILEWNSIDVPAIVQTLTR